MNAENIKREVRKSYGEIAEKDGSCCGPSACCGNGKSVEFGYSPEELARLPQGADLGLGCGNPTAMAGLKKGETVLDLGSGAGIDCFLAGKAVGEGGWVIGVDMTEPMIEKARANAQKTGVTNVEFRLGEIEHLPVDDNSVDVVISNCVINLSPDKPAVFREMFRALKPGGRFAVSDIVTKKQLPEFVLRSIEAYAACIAGAVTKDEYLDGLKAAGFVNVRVTGESVYPVTFSEVFVSSLKVEGDKPEY